MSRHVNTLQEEPRAEWVAYGYDHALGYWFDHMTEDEEGEEVVLLSESSYGTQMSRSRMIELMQLFNCSREHIQMVAMDLAF